MCGGEIAAGFGEEKGHSYLTTLNEEGKGGKSRSSHRKIPTRTGKRRQRKNMRTLYDLEATRPQSGR